MPRSPQEGLASLRLVLKRPGVETYHRPPITNLPTTQLTQYFVINRQVSESTFAFNWQRGADATREILAV